MKNIFYALIFITTAGSVYANACSIAAIADSQKVYDLAKKNFDVGEVTKNELSAARDAFIMNQFCKEVSNKSISCVDLHHREEAKFLIASTHFRLGEITNVELKEFAARLSVALDYCF